MKNSFDNKIEFFENGNSKNKSSIKKGYWNTEKILSLFLFFIYIIPNFLNRVHDSLNYKRLPPIYQRLHNANVNDFLQGTIGIFIILLLIWFTGIFSEHEGPFQGMDIVKSPKIIVKILAWIIFITPIVLYFYSIYISKTPLNLYVPSFNIEEIQRSWTPGY